MYSLYRSDISSQQATVKNLARTVKQEAIVTNCHNQSSFVLSNARSYFEKHYETKLEGCGFLYANHPNCEYPEHCCLHHTVVVYLRSQPNSVRQIGDTLQTENINLGDVAIIPTQTTHYRKTKSETLEVIIITIAPNLLSRLAKEKIDAYKIEILPSFARSNLLIQSIALNLKAEFDSGNCDRSYVESLYNALMMHLLNNHSQKEYYSQHNSGLVPYKLKQALTYINNNIDRSIKIRDVAELLGISQYYFCRLFRESTGISPYRYVIQQRVSKAKTLIESDKMSLSDITFECGFSSQSQMTHHFRKLTGTTPKVYRDRLKQPL